MNSKQITFGIIIFLLLIAVITNPTQDIHQAVTETKLNEYLQQSINENIADSDDVWEQAGQTLGLMFSGVLVDQIINNMISSDNYIFFSTTKLSWSDETKIIGFGIFGNVFLSSKLDQAFEEVITNNQ